MRNFSSRTSDFTPTDALEEVREAERRGVARELHDSVIQPLSALVVSLESLRHQPLTPGAAEAYLGAWEELAREALDALRGALAGMHTHPHAAVGLPEALRRYVMPQARSRGVRVTLECRDWPEDLPIDVTTSLYLTVREALTNIEKHARASEVTVLLRGEAGQLAILLVDDGVGFTPGEPAAAGYSAGYGLGIPGMIERARLLGGQLHIVATPGSGTRIELRIPR